MVVLYRVVDRVLLGGVGDQELRGIVARQGEKFDIIRTLLNIDREDSHDHTYIYIFTLTYMHIQYTVYSNSINASRQHRLNLLQGISGYAGNTGLSGIKGAKVEYLSLQMCLAD